MATHTPRSILWLLANGSNQFGLTELLCSMPAGETEISSLADSSRFSHHSIASSVSLVRWMWAGVPLNRASPVKAVMATGTS